MDYKVSKDGFTFQGLLDPRNFKVFQGSYSSPILNHALDERQFEPLWKSGPA